MPEDPFTPSRERLRRAEIAEALRQGTLRAPVWLLCPGAALRQELEAAVASAGGGFFRVVDWSVLATHLDFRLGLPFAAPIEETERALVVERMLVALSAAKPALRDALAADPFGVSASLLGVVDLLRAHGWRGGDGGSLDVSGDEVDAIASSHLATLAALARGLEDHLAARGQLDVVGRLRRAAAALEGGRSSGIPALLVEGVDRVDPTQRRVLLGLRATGCGVNVAPWVLGFSAEAPEPPPTSAATLLEALQRGALRVDAPGDGSVCAVRVRDPWEEAEAVARWIAERAARGASPSTVAVRVGGSSGAADRVRRSLARWGVGSCGAGRVSVRSTPLWQIVRAGVRLAWRGVDAVDLATILAAPGAGVWGGDRDRLIAAIRRAAPTAWRGVRDVLRDTLTDEEPVGDGGDEAPAPADPARQRRLAEARARVEELVDLFEQHGPFVRHAASDRRRLLKGAVDGLIARFIVTERFAESVRGPRERTAWLLAAQAIEAALRVELARIEERALLLPAGDASGFLTAAESLLGDVEDDLAPPMDEGVAVLDEHSSPRRRPDVLIVTGFVRGRYPSSPAPRLLLGARERAAIDRALPPQDALPSPDQDQALAWRDTLRLLALPRERLLIFAPARGVDGKASEPSLTWTDLLARMRESDRISLQRRGMTRVEDWLEAELGAPRTRRGRRQRAAAALGRGEVERARSLAEPLAEASVATRDFFAARLRPERRYELGDLVRGRLSEAVFSARDLEAALTCRYRFLADAVLGLRPHRFARASGVSPGERARAVRASLRRIDARLTEEGRVSGDEVDLAVEASIASRGGTLADEEELRRATRGFVLRYLGLREAWTLRDGVDAEEQVAASFDVELVSGRVIKARAQMPRVEFLSDGTSTAVAVDFTLRSLDGAARLRDLGLDLDAALAPYALASRHADSAVGGYVRLSLAKPVGDALAGRAATTRDELIDPFETASSATAVRVERSRRVEDHRDVSLGMLSGVFDEMDADDAAFAPHDEAEFERLKDGGARTCDRCDARLACRFRMAGGE